MGRKVGVLLDFINFGLFVFLIMAIWFRHQIDVAPWMEVAGRFHLVLLHLPIGAFSLYVVWHFLLKDSRSDDQNANKDQVLFHTVFFTSLVASLSGLFHSLGGDFPEQALDNHMNGALIFTLGLFICQFLSKPRLLSVGIIASLAALVYTGHIGGSLTHGEDFLWPKNSINQVWQGKPAADATIYDALIQPIFNAKCVSCHSDTKSKGGLKLIDSTTILAGGKHGYILKPHDIAESKIYQFAMLPLKDKNHMPPDGKAQLTKDEISILRYWIESGASYSKKCIDVQQQDSLYSYIVRIYAQNQNSENEKVYDFEAAGPDLIRSIANAYVHISPISLDKPALSARFFVSQNFNPDYLRKAQKLKDQITQIDLTNMPLTDADAGLLIPFVHVEQLILNGTKLTTASICALSKLEKLEKLSLSNTAVDEKLEPCLSSFKALRHIYLNDTKISKEAIRVWQQKYPTIQFYFLDKLDDKIPLTAPLILNKNHIVQREEKVELVCNIKGSQIRYTRDGSAPDSLFSLLYDKPFTIDKTTRVRAISVKDDWLNSSETDVTFFKSGIKPKSVSILHPAHEKYPGLEALTFYNDKMAPIENLKDDNWIAFKDKPLVSTFTFPPSNNTIRSVFISFARHIPQYVFPPKEIRLYGIESNGKSTLLSNSRPSQISENYAVGVTPDYTILDIKKPQAYISYRLEADNLDKIPNWHPGRGETAWLFIDEIFWYE